MKSEIFNLAQNKINESFNLSDQEKIEIGEIPSVELDYSQFEDEIRSLINFTKEEKFFGDKYYSLFVYGPTGSGKSEITERLALEEDCVYHKLEIQKVPIEILQGFPYLVDLETEHGKMKVAKLAPSTILPPSDDKRTWLLHLDEFNKADPDKMAAVMNLVMTGEIGGSADYSEKEGKSVKYKLPRKTLIIGCGNPKNQSNIENMNIVSGMDTATSERWHRTAYLPYNASSWLENFALKEHNVFGHKVPTRIPAIIINFIIDKILENGNDQDPFLIPIISGSKEGMEGERTTSPRSWTFVADMMYTQMYSEFNSKDGSFADFVSNPHNQVKFLKKQVLEFGIEGQRIITDIISRYIYFGENRVIPSNILEDYRHHREKIKALSKKKGMMLYLLLGIAYEINDIKGLDERSLKLYCVNVSTFIEDSNIPSEDIVAFIQTLKKSNNKTSEEFNEFMISISERYKEAYSGYFHTSINEI